MSGSRGGRVHKGDRRAVSLRVPEEHHAFYRERAARFQIPVSDFIACQIALCCGLDIPAEVFHSDPGVIRMHSPESWVTILRGLSPAAAAKVRRTLRAAWPQILEDFAELEETGSSVSPDVLEEIEAELFNEEGRLPLTG